MRYTRLINIIIYNNFYIFNFFLMSVQYGYTIYKYIASYFINKIYLNFINKILIKFK